VEWIFCSITSKVNRDSFDCGISELNDYLKKYARQNHQKGIARTIVAISAIGNPDVLGYYSVSMSEIQRESLPQKYSKGLPRYPIPALRIGKLAVARTMQGKGLGKALLMECLRLAIRLASDVGVFAVIVDAINEQARNFYLKYGFILLENQERSLFISLGTLSKAVE
jgi:GNAT superfamily N-acetyltransferase